MLRVEPQLIANYVATGDVKLTFHPMLDHGNSALLHQAAECAGEQDPLAFWQLHGVLFENQGDLFRADSSAVAVLATGIGLDGPALQSCVDSGRYAEKVQRMDDARQDMGIRLRPSFDINGQVYPGAQPFPNFVSVIDGILGN